MYLNILSWFTVGRKSPKWIKFIDRCVKHWTDMTKSAFRSYCIVCFCCLVVFSLTRTDRYGYRGRDCRANVYLLPTGEIVYFIASVVVLFNYEERTQRHYLGHTDCVKWWDRWKHIWCDWGHAVIWWAWLNYQLSLNISLKDAGEAQRTVTSCASFTAHMSKFNAINWTIQFKTCLHFILICPCYSVYI